MGGVGTDQVQGRGRRLLEGVVDRLQPHVAAVVEVRVMTAIARRQDVRIGSPAMIVDVNAVGAFDARGHGQLVGREYTHTNNDHVGGMLGTVFRQHRAYTT